MLNCRAKNEVKRSNHSEDISYKRIKQERILWPKLKNQTVKQLEITDQFAVSMDAFQICKKLASYLNSVLTYSKFDIITFGMPKCV